MDENLILQDIRPSRSDAVKNRELLLETAQQLFAQYGVDAVSMSAVAQSAGVGKGTLYRHFPSKTHLCEQLIDADQRDLQERTLRHMRENPGDPLGSLHWFLDEAFAFVERNHDLLLSALLVDVHSMLVHPAHFWWRQTIRGLLLQIKPHIDIDYAADVLYVMLDARIVAYQQRGNGFDRQRILNGLHETVDRLIS